LTKIELGASRLDFITAALHLIYTVVETLYMLKVQKIFCQLYYPESGCCPPRVDLDLWRQRRNDLVKVV